ncbi:MAG TPA: biopolymer transporter ExbD [Caulobacterales bacterium]|nr:biopolymer transporter ExbD [Caulobacterales bacterium]
MAAKLNTNSKTNSARLASDPNVIPFIDVLLVLLVIFMVTAPMPTVDIKVDLPQGVSVPPPQGISPTIVVLREAGSGVEFAVDGEVVSENALTAKVLEHVRANNPALPLNEIYANARIYVRADQAIAYANVVHVIDALQLEGYAKVGIFAELAENDH